MLFLLCLCYLICILSLVGVGFALYLAYIDHWNDGFIFVLFLTSGLALMVSVAMISSMYK